MSLLPCPLCGRPVRMIEYDGDPVNVKHRVVHDDASLLTCPMDTMWCDLGPEIVAKRWNTRTPPPRAQGGIVAPVSADGREVTVTEEMVEAALRTFDYHTGWAVSDYTSKVKEQNLRAMRAALTAALGGEGK